MKKNSSPALDYRNTNSLWSSVLVETLFRLGLRHAVISPGSRTTALTMAFTRHQGIESIPVLDERSASFLALGLAKSGQTPVVLLCTSGTAGANYFSAVIEAQESGVPLLVITADRPPEMRECSSGQTIDQQKLFGAHVNFYHELAVPTPTLPLLRYLRQTVCHAWERTMWPVLGPVHLNAPFRDPLPPLKDGSTDELRAKLIEKAFFANLGPSAVAECSTVVPQLPQTDRGLIVLGMKEGRYAADEIEALASMARRLGWPVLVDSLSGLRDGESKFPSMITHYDAIMRNPASGKKLRPELILCFGGWPISKALRSWLETMTAPVWMVNARQHNLDSLHGLTRHLRCGVKKFAEAIGSGVLTACAYQQAWVRAEIAAGRAIKQAMTKLKNFEGQVVVTLAKSLPAKTPIFVANSMPIRDLEYFWPASDHGHVIYFNRGANGIDGTLSTALGIAHGERRPTVLLTGDLALLHDTNGFLVRRQFRGGLTIVLINNNGGGIFEHLPVAQFNPPFEQYFATPQDMDFKKLCASYGVKYQLIRDEAHLSKEVAALSDQGIRVLEVRTDRALDAARRKKLFAQAAIATAKAI